ncbi:MAG: hypothetical protein R6X07_04065 [Desulfatiglandales bacterium]
MKCRALLGHYGGHHFLPPLFVGDTDHRRLKDSVHEVDHLLRFFVAEKSDGCFLTMDHEALG